jgi:hypothetical protein
VIPREMRIGESAGAIPIMRAVPTPTLPDTAGQAVRWMPAEDAVAGAVFVTSAAGTAAAPTQIAYYTTPDGVPRKGTVVVAPGAIYTQGNIPAIANENGVYVKITMGTKRASVSRWVGSPCIFPVEGSWVKVEALISGVPFQVQGSQTIASGLNGQPVTAPSGATAWQSQVTCTVIDGWTDYGPSTPIVLNNPCGLTAQLFGPVIVDDLSLSNFNATASVQLAIIDKTGTPYEGGTPSAGGHMIGSVIVPAGTTVSVGRSLLGPFGLGLALVGFTGNPAAGALTHDPNDANVFASVWGKYLGVS